MHSMTKSIISLFVLIQLALLPTHAFSQSTTTGKSGLPLPRFVSLKSSKVNMRVGPGNQYKVVWLYQRKGLPMEIIQEFDNWRKVRDPKGDEGWVHGSLLAGDRSAIIKPWDIGKSSDPSQLLNSNRNNAPLVAKIEAGVVAKVIACDIDWCKVRHEAISGYIPKKDIWGVYPDETIEE